jgi:hypothetical protein
MIVVRVKRSPTAWETFTATSEEDALSKIREQYPSAVSYPWGIDREGAAVASQVMYVYESEDRSRLVARMRKET